MDRNISWILFPGPQDVLKHMRNKEEWRNNEIIRNSDYTVGPIGSRYAVTDQSAKRVYTEIEAEVASIKYQIANMIYNNQWGQYSISVIVYVIFSTKPP